MQLREYQERFVSEIAKSLVKNQRIVAQLATGGGKTVTFSAISKRFFDKSGQRVLILVHRIELLEQAARTIQNNTGLKAAKIVAGMRSIPDANIYVAMVETTYRRLDKLPEFGLIIIDEVHIGNFTKLIEHYNNKYIIGFTATPIAAKKENPLKKYFNDIVCGVSIRELIEQGHLCSAITFGVKEEIDRAVLKTTKGDYDIDQMAEIMSNHKYIESVVNSYTKLAYGVKTLIFNCNVEHSLLVYHAFIKSGLNCQHLDGEMDSVKRKEIMKWFNETPDAILCNIGIATTGFDQPDIECIIVNRATASMPLWLQMCGRGARPTPSKNSFTIIDMGGNGIVHGKWEFDRDWNFIFNNPERKGNGDAPSKKCPECDCIVHARVKLCENCGYEWKDKPIEEVEPVTLVSLSAGIDIDKYIEIQKERNYKEFYGLIKSLEDFTNIALSQSKSTSHEIKNAIYQQAQEISLLWAQKVGQHNRDKVIFVARKFVSEQFSNHPLWKKSLFLSTKM